MKILLLVMRLLLASSVALCVVSPGLVQFAVLGQVFIQNVLAERMYNDWPQ